MHDNKNSYLIWRHYRVKFEDSNMLEIGRIHNINC